MAYHGLARVYELTHETSEAEVYYRKAIKLNSRHVPSYLHLGWLLKASQRWQDAVEVFKKLIKITPADADLHSSIAECYQSLGQASAAVNHYSQAAKLGDPAARYQIKILNGEDLPTLPKNETRQLFDEDAHSFEKKLTAVLGYQVPQLMFDEANRFTEGKMKFIRMLDIGCGTGLVGTLFKNNVQQLIGIDLSKKMLAEAKKKNVYDELVSGDIFNYLLKKEKFDLIVAADVFIYVGDLDRLFSLLYRVMTPNSLLIFSTEKTQGQTFKLQPSGRYAHAISYIKSLSIKNKLVIKSCKPIQLRQEFSYWIEGHLYILQKLI